MRYGVNAWIGFVAGIAAGAAVGAIIGGLAFRAGLRSSYFALVTLAFAEVLRILASVAPSAVSGMRATIAPTSSPTLVSTRYARIRNRAPGVRRNRRQSCIGRITICIPFKCSLRCKASAV